MISWLLASSLIQPDPGLVAWRTLDRRGRACASCHSPDGIELAAYSFDEGDVVRRASAHLPPPLRERIAQFILTQRKRFDRKPLDPISDRPMQPGGKPLAGETARDRDLAFLKTLPQLVPSLASGKIDSLATANQACREVVALDLSTVRVGIPMNRLSEDRFHGDEHASLAHWIPDVSVASSPEAAAAQAEYLARPSRESLGMLDNAVQKTFQPNSPIEALALAKYRAMLEMQHSLRVTSGWSAPEPAPIRRDNPYWQVAELGRTYAGADAQLFALPAEIAGAKAGGPSMPEQMRSLRLPWYWLGWLRDPTLTHSGGMRETLRADYFAQSLLHDGPYAVHAAFMLFRKLSQQAAEGRPWEVQFSFLLLDRPLTEWEPQNPGDRRLFRRVIGNIFRAALWRLKDEIERSGSALYPESQSLQVRLIDRYLHTVGEAEVSLVATVQRLLASARRGQG